jgi:hypothetical protein
MSVSLTKPRMTAEAAPVPTVSLRPEEVRPGDVIVQGDLRASVASRPYRFSANLIGFDIDWPHFGEWLDRPETRLDVEPAPRGEGDRVVIVGLTTHALATVVKEEDEDFVIVRRDSVTAYADRCLVHRSQVFPATTLGPARA